MPQFRKKPVVIEAVKWTIGERIEDCWMLQWPSDGRLSEEFTSRGAAMDWVKRGEAAGEWSRDELRPALVPVIKTLEGAHVIAEGDWVITGVQGERYPCKPDIFAATYDLV